MRYGCFEVHHAPIAQNGPTDAKTLNFGEMRQLKTFDDWRYSDRFALLCEVVGYILLELLHRKT